MVNMTLAVPDELNSMIKKHSEIKWSEIARKAMWEHARKLELVEKIVAKSKLTEKDAEEIGKKIKQGLREKYFKWNLLLISL